MHSPRGEAGPRYGSDVLVDLMRATGVAYVALNPGASLRGLHDSLVNYGDGGSPQLILCCHEETAVNVAHGFAKAAGRPMVAAVHNLVGLQHATMGIHTAWVDQEPVLVVGGTGPVDAARRRPWIDSIHTAVPQAVLVREYVKWDDQPASVEAMVDSWLTAWRLAVSPPPGPVYLCYDVELQEGPVPEGFRLPVDVSRRVEGQWLRLAVDSQAVREVAGWLCDARSPAILADLAVRGRGAEVAWRSLQELAEALGAPVVDLGSRLNFPSDHPLDLTDREEQVLAEADCVLALDLRDPELAVLDTHRDDRTRVRRVAPGAKVVHVGLQELRLRGWSCSLPPHQHLELSLVAEPAELLPALVEEVRRRQTTLHRLAAEDRRRRWSRVHEQARQQWRQRARERARLRPIALEFLAAQLGEVLDHLQPWSVVSGAMKGWPRRLWAMREPLAWLGTTGRGSVGFGLGIGLGATLALKDSGRFCVALQPDGDLLYTPSALWTAARYRLPLLVVMFNNRSYYNDEEHQELVARARGRPVERKGVGIRLEDPEVDFAALARSFGVFGLGPVAEPDQLGPALQEAARYVQQEQRPALVDVVTQNR